MNIKVFAAAFIAVLLGIIGFNYYSSQKAEQRAATHSAEVAKLQAKAAAMDAEAAPSNPKQEAEPVQPISNNQPQTAAMPVASDEELFNPPRAVYNNQGSTKKARLIADKAKMDAVLKRWNDALKIATNTPRIQLGAKIEDLQAIKREVSNMQLSQCMIEPRNRLAKAMTIFIDGLLGFKSDTTLGVFLFRHYAEKANKDMQLYNVISEQCISLA